MFTNDFLKDYNTASKDAAMAERTIRGLEHFKIAIPEVMTKALEKDKVFNMLCLDYILAKLPKGLIDELEVELTSGAFITESNKVISFNAEVVMRCNGFKHLRIKYNTTEDLCYYSASTSEELESICAKYDSDTFIKNTNYDAWITVK